MIYKDRAYKIDNESGFIGALVLGLGAVVVGAIAYFSIGVPQSEKITILSSQNTNQLAQVGVFLPEKEEVVENQPVEPVKEETAPNSEPTKLALATNVIEEENTAPQKEIEPAVSLELIIPVTNPVIENEEEPKPFTLIVEKGDQPDQSLLIAGAAHVPFTVINLTAQGGDVEIKNLIIERRGPASDRIFVEVGVENHDTERSLNAKHQYTMRKSFTIPEGETEEIMLFGNGAYDLTDYEGQSVGLALVGIEANAPIEGQLPIVGTYHITNSTLTIGSLTLTSSGLDPATNRNLDLNAKNVIFSAVKATAGGQEPVKLSWFSWLQKGSIGNDDIENVKIGVVYKDKTYLYDAEPDDSHYFTAEFGDEFTIAKGDSVDIFIRGDVTVKAVNRTVDFDIDSTYDFLSYGTIYKNYFYGSGGEEDGAQDEGLFSDIEGPFYNGYAHTVVPGSLNSITK